MSSRTKVFINNDEFEAELFKQGLNTSTAAKQWGVSRTTLHKIKAGEGISLATAQQLISKGGLTYSIIRDKNLFRAIKTKKVRIDPFPMYLHPPPESGTAETQVFKSCYSKEFLSEDATYVYGEDYVELLPCNSSEILKLAMTGYEDTWTWCDPANDILQFHRFMRASWALNEGTIVSKAAERVLKQLNEQLEVRAKAQKTSLSLEGLLSKIEASNEIDRFDELLLEEKLQIYGGMVETYIPMINEPWAQQTPYMDFCTNAFFIVAHDDYDYFELIMESWKLKENN